jgi:transposase
LGALKAQLLAQVALAPEQTLVQLCQWVKAEHGIAVGPTTMGRTLVRSGLTLKKNTLHARRARTCRRSPGPRGLARTTICAGDGRAAGFSR